MAAADAWDDLLLDGLPNVTELDDWQADCGLNGAGLVTGLPDLDCLGLEPLGDIGGGGHDPATSDVFESLQMDVAEYQHVTSSNDAPQAGSKSGSGSPLAGAARAAAGGPAVRAHSAELSAHAGQAQVTPATSESENQAGGRLGSPAVASQLNVQAGAAVEAQTKRNMSEDEKRLARMQRNRENAQLSRQRKKQQMADLESRCVTLARHNAQLLAAMQRLTAENATLRQQLALICQQAGKSGSSTASAPAKHSGSDAAKQALPTAPSNGAQKSAAAGLGGAQLVSPAGAAVRGLLPQWPVLPVGLLPRVAQAGQQAARPPSQPDTAAAATSTAVAGRAAAGQPAPAATANPSQPATRAPKVAVQTQAVAQQQAGRQSTQHAATNKRTVPTGALTALAAGPTAPQTAQKASRPAKRAKTAAAGASTAFLALFTLFMFAGPFTPAPMTAPGAASGSATASLGRTGGQRLLQALPQAPAAIMGPAALSPGLQRTGRSLQALPAAQPAHELPSLPQQEPALNPVAQQHLVKPGDGLRLQQLLNSTVQALLLEPGNAAAEAAALQRLQELAPVALLLDADDGGSGTSGRHGGANPLAASAAFPDLAGQLFGSAGLEMPQMCQKVLEFDAASVPHAARSRRSLERFVLGATGLKGRSLAAAPSLPGTAGSDGCAPAGDREPLTISSHPAPRMVIREQVEGDESGKEVADGDSGGGGGSATALMPHRQGGDAPVLVSVLLPANASEGGEAGARLSGVDKVYVVLLHPQEKFTTYSCALPRTVVL